MIATGAWLNLWESEAEIPAWYKSYFMLDLTQKIFIFQEPTYLSP
jgi:hypothetical protein